MQIFPKHPSAPDTYYIGGGWSPACITAVEKRFTDAELAAEVLMHERDHWKSIANGQLRQQNYDRLLRIRAIAAAPHYDENPA